MRGVLAVAGLRLREALAGGVIGLLPLHFCLALALAAGMPGPSPEARREAADAAALGLAALLGLVAAALLGAAPLPAERERARGALLLAAPPGPGARVAGTALGSGAALLLLLLALEASALGAVQAVLGAAPPPRVRVLPAALDGGAADPREEGLRWLTAGTPRAVATFAAPPVAETELLLEARPRVGPGGAMPGLKRATLRFFPGPGDGTLVPVAAPHPAPFRVRVPAGTTMVKVERVEGNFDLGLRRDGLSLDGGPRPRALARGLHAAALGGGLLAALAAALLLSTVAGSAVAAAGTLTLSLLSLFRGRFSEAASMLAHAGAVERAMEAAGGGAAAPEPGTPPALAPLFRALAGALPDGSRFDLAAPVAGNQVPAAGAVLEASAFGLGLSLVLLAAAAAAARRRP